MKTFKDFFKKQKPEKKKNFKVGDLVVSKSFSTYVGRIKKIDGDNAYVATTSQKTWDYPLKDLSPYKGKISDFKLGRKVKEKGDGLLKNGVVYAYLVNGKVEVQWNTGKFQTVEYKDIK